MKSGEKPGFLLKQLNQCSLPEAAVSRCSYTSYWQPASPPEWTRLLHALCAQCSLQTNTSTHAATCTTSAAAFTLKCRVIVILYNWPHMPPPKKKKNPLTVGMCTPCVETRRVNGPNGRRLDRFSRFCTAHDLNKNRDYTAPSEVIVPLVGLSMQVHAMRTRSQTKQLINVRLIPVSWRLIVLAIAAIIRL